MVYSKARKANPNIFSAKITYSIIAIVVV